LVGKEEKIERNRVKMIASIENRANIGEVMALGFWSSLM
jgi:hypothetical protein